MPLASGLDAGASTGAHALARYRSEFPIFRDAVYLNTCSLGALGERTRRRTAEFLDLWQARGASAWYDVWWAALGELRARYARIVGASPEEIALAPTQDIGRVAAAAHKSGALCLVDASQSVGQVPVDVKAAGVDFLIAGGLKWLLGGPGIVLLYVRDELARRLAPGIAGWFGHKNQFAFDSRALELHDDARRFELGTPALAAVYAQLGGLDYIDEIGVPAIRRVTSALTEDLVARARERGFRPHVAPRAEDRSAIVMLPAADPAAGVRHLAAGRIIVDARPGHVRLSPFFYNLQDDHASALERLAAYTDH